MLKENISRALIRVDMQRQMGEWIGEHRVIITSNERRERSESFSATNINCGLIDSRSYIIINSRTFWARRLLISLAASVIFATLVSNASPRARCSADSRSSLRFREEHVRIKETNDVAEQAMNTTRVHLRYPKRQEKSHKYTTVAPIRKARGRTKGSGKNRCRAW